MGGGGGGALAPCAYPEYPLSYASGTVMYISVHHKPSIWISQANVWQRIDAYENDE